MSAESLKVRFVGHLSKRQGQVLKMLAEGETTKGIALRLKVSAKDVEFHRLQLMNRTNLHNYADLTKLALRLGLTEINV